MKYLIVLTALVFFTVSAFGQASKFDPKKEANSFISKLNLDSKQSVKILKIMEHKLENLNSIENLRTTNLEKFILKSESIYRGTSNSISLILTKEQMPLFNKWQLSIRNKRAEIRKKMKSKGKSNLEIRLAETAIQ